ncbi:ABC transporter substrate-binding protein [Natronospira bacteriovora]|uniref:ABC transporter substrate-binding protein n=1 Tax=Natronospira bacteriovora TaxID=3069753 RepID=A0ABU0W8Z6_9GAMM|nr:ABC transporter substrate-binding protein [Natronospira sp. AB-CW4]MDQ2070503.1 ABC transporter substrate-binding protein [Natronospira sp. AB-CW4]
MRLSGVIYLGDLPTLIAHEKGFFRAQGLELDVEFGVSGKDNLARLRAGELDFALMALTPLVLDVLNQSPTDDANAPLILANVSHSLGLNYVVARPDSGIESPADLPGRPFGVMPGTNAEFLLSRFARYHGIRIDEKDIRPMPTPEVHDALLEGSLEAGVLWEPWASQLESRLGEALVRFPVRQVYTARWVLVARRGVMDADPEAAEGLLRAYLNTVNFIERNQDEAIAIYARHAELSPDLVRRQWDGLIYGLTLNWALVTGIRQQAEWARANGLASVDSRLDVFSLIERRPLQRMAPTLVLLPGNPPVAGRAE